MTEPSLALQTAIRGRLIASPQVLELVKLAEIRDGDANPDAFPSILLGSAQAVTAGHYGSYRNSTCYLDLHIWAENREAAATIGAAVSKALFAELLVSGFDLTDGLHLERSIYMRDPDGYGHGVVSLRALMGGAL